MKLLCCADFHLGAGAEYGPRPGDRLRDQERVLTEIARISHEEDVEAVLFAGDAFDRRRPSPEEIHIWQEFVYQTTQYTADLVSIDGNHDVIAADVFCAPELAIGGYHHRTPGIRELKAHRPESERAYVATLPWTPPARLVASRGGGDRDELHAEAAQLLLQSARDLRAQIPEGRPSILLAHWSVSGAVTPTGADVGLFREVVLPLPDLLGLGFDFVVLGHIHETQVLASNVVADFRSENGTEAMGTGSVAFYVGSPMVLNFGEAQGHHGVMLLDTEARSLRHVEIPDRPFVTVDVDLTTEEGLPFNRLDLDETDAISAAIAERFPLTDAVVRIRYKATAEQARRVDHAALRGLLADAGASKLYAIQPEIVRSERARIAGVDETIDEIKAFKLWLEASGTTISPVDGGPLPELEEQLLERHARYLEEAVT